MKKGLSMQRRVLFDYFFFTQRTISPMIINQPKRAFQLKGVRLTRNVTFMITSKI